MILLANRFYPALALNQTWQLSSWFRFCGPSALLRADVHEKVAIDTACGCFCGEIGQGRQGEGAHGSHRAQPGCLLAAGRLVWLGGLPRHFPSQCGESSPIRAGSWADLYRLCGELEVMVHAGRGCLLEMACVCFWLAKFVHYVWVFKKFAFVTFACLGFGIFVFEFDRFGFGILFADRV